MEIQNRWDFDLSQTYEYYVHSFARSHTMLEVEVNENLLGKQYILFEGICYFEGPLQWKGSAFIQGTSEQCLAILRKTSPIYKVLSDDELLNSYYLFISTQVDKISQIRVIAMRSSLSRASTLDMYRISGNLSA